MSLKKSEDPIIYFTLIDFLVQLIFLTLFIFVALRASEISKPSPPWLDDPDYLPLINEALTPYINGESAKTLAKLLKELFEREKGQETLAKLLDFLRLNERPLETLGACARDPSVCTALIAQCKSSPKSCEVLAAMPASKFGEIGNDKGAGKPHCLPSTNRVLFTITSGRAGDIFWFDISNINYTKEAESYLQELDLDGTERVRLSLAEFAARFSRLTSKPCQHTIRYDDQVGVLDVYKTVNRYFYLANR